jgi:hypothetical protein
MDLEKEKLLTATYEQVMGAWGGVESRNQRRRGERVYCQVAHHLNSNIANHFLTSLK